MTSDVDVVNQIWRPLKRGQTKSSGHWALALGHYMAPIQCLESCSEVYLYYVSAACATKVLHMHSKACPGWCILDQMHLLGSLQGQFHLKAISTVQLWGDKGTNDATDGSGHRTPGPHCCLFFVKELGVQEDLSNCALLTVWGSATHFRTENGKFFVQEELETQRHRVFPGWSLHCFSPSRPHPLSSMWTKPQQYHLISPESIKMLPFNSIVLEGPWLIGWSQLATKA